MADPDVTRIAAAHARLMRAYLDVLTHLDSLGFFPIWSLPMPGPRVYRWMRRVFGLFTIRAFVRLFVHSHLLGRSRALRTAYVQLAQPLGDDQAAQRKWLFDAAESLEAFEKTLDTFTSLKGLVNLAWPVAAGFYLAWSGADSLYAAMLTLALPPIEVLLAAAMFPLVYFSFFLSAAFDYKRALFAPADAGPYQRTSWKGSNLYALENDLFESVGRRKRQEFPVDVLFYVLGSGTFGAVPMYLAFAAAEIDWTLVVSGSFFLVLAAAMPLTLRRRRWR